MIDIETFYGQHCHVLIVYLQCRYTAVKDVVCFESTSKVPLQPSEGFTIQITLCCCCCSSRLAALTNSSLSDSTGLAGKNMKLAGQMSSKSRVGEPSSASGRVER
jgi:hypothetical protein